MTTMLRRLLVVVLAVAIAVPVLLQGQAARTLGVKRSFASWGQYLGGSDSSQYSSLNQVNRSNVSQLDVVWRYATADRRSYRFNPIVVDGTMFVLAKDNSIVALDALTGKELWAHPNQGAVGDRGINYWESADRTDRRLLYVNNGALTAIDAKTGASIASFGNGGSVDLRTGLH